MASDVKPSYYCGASGCGADLVECRRAVTRGLVGAGETPLERVAGAGQPKRRSYRETVHSAQP